MTGVLQATWAMEDDCSGCQRRAAARIHGAGGVKPKPKPDAERGQLLGFMARRSASLSPCARMATYTGFEESRDRISMRGKGREAERKGSGAEPAYISISSTVHCDTGA